MQKPGASSHHGGGSTIRAKIEKRKGTRAGQYSQDDSDDDAAADAGMAAAAAANLTLAAPVDNGMEADEEGKPADGTPGQEVTADRREPGAVVAAEEEETKTPDAVTLDIPEGRSLVDIRDGLAHEPGRHYPEPIRPASDMISAAYYAHTATLAAADVAILTSSAEDHARQVITEVRARQSMPVGASLLWCASLQEQLASLKERIVNRERRDESMEDTKAKLLLTGIQRCGFQRRQELKAWLQQRLGAGLYSIDDTSTGARPPSTWLLHTQCAEAAAECMAAWRALTVWEPELATSRLHHADSYPRWLKESCRRCLISSWGSLEQTLHLQPMNTMHKDSRFHCLRLSTNTAKVLAWLCWNSTATELDLYVKCPTEATKPLFADYVERLQKALRTTSKTLPFDLAIHRLSGGWNIPTLMPLQLTRQGTKGVAEKGKPKGAGKSKAAGVKGAQKGKGGKGRALPRMHG
mmetsp:Transcript_31826/g.74365  ORF Transcript_31826/g.74365 Transcript_31826/m.74365 type:complete len:466 (+) Transcript_31826:193-1590(+)